MHDDQVIPTIHVQSCNRWHYHCVPVYQEEAALPFSEENLELKWYQHFWKNWHPLHFAQLHLQTLQFFDVLLFLK